MKDGKYYPRFTAGFARLLAEADGKPIAVVGHARPDGDCIGAQVALARVLEQRGCAVVCVNADPVPRRLKFLVGGLKFLRPDEARAAVSGHAAIFVDCADLARPGERLKALYPAPLAEIDHHLSNGGFAGHNFVDTGSAATCQILAGLFFDAGLPVDALAAQALYVGILTDTGQFRFSSTTQRTFQLAAELLGCGASPSEAGAELFEQESAGRLQLLQRFLSSLRLEGGGRLCIGTLPVGIFEATGTTAEDTEGLVDYARSIEGVRVGVLIERRADGSVKASLRSKDPAYRLDRVAAQFNGGGHACAAGLNLKQNTENFDERLVAAILRQIEAVENGNKLP